VVSMLRSRAHSRVERSRHSAEASRQWILACWSVMPVTVRRWCECLIGLTLDLRESEMGDGVALADQATQCLHLGRFLSGSAGLTAGLAVPGPVGDHPVESFPVLGGRSRKNSTVAIRASRAARAAPTAVH
jgi:hypothetical protein